MLLVYVLYRLINEDMDNRIAKLKIQHADEEDGIKEEITQIEHDCVSVLIIMYFEAPEYK